MVALPRTVVEKISKEGTVPKTQNAASLCYDSSLLDFAHITRSDLPFLLPGLSFASFKFLWLLYLR